MTNTERLIDLLKELTDADMISVHNEYCYKNNYYGDVIHELWELDDMNHGRSIIDIIADYKDLDLTCKYFQEDEVFLTHNSFDYYDECNNPFYKEIAEYCLTNDCDLYDGDIRNFLDELQEENED